MRIKSPFKFLDAYGKEDYKRFFGREKETAQLFNAVHRSNLTLLYGASGTGKSSLVNCGLGNKFYEPDWLPLFIRRQENINEAIDTALTNELQAVLGNRQSDIPAGSIADKLKLLYEEYYRPVYLIFDQFEELFVLGSTEEQNRFYQNIQQLLTVGLRTRILIIMREEWIAYLYDFEKAIPMLFENRLRIEKMSEHTLYNVIYATCTSFNIEIEEPEVTIKNILKNIRDKKHGIELTNMQVYLDRLYQQFIANHPNLDKPIVFTSQLVEKVGPMENVLSAFLEEEFTQIEKGLKLKGLRNAKGVPLEVLFALVTENGTKHALTNRQIAQFLPQNRAITTEHIKYCLEEFKKLRLLRQLGND